jgi:nicotinamidase-related amidase
VTELRTLRDIAGLPRTPGKLAEAALILVDCQQTYRTGLMQLTGVEAALQQAQALLERARSVGAPVFHIQHDSGPGSPYDIRAEIGSIAREVAPRSGEPVIVKNFPNAFVNTDLHARLQAINAKQVVLAGFMTHMCINSTARGAFNLGYTPAVVASATATRSLPAPDGGVVSAQALQTASLAALQDLFAVVVDDPRALA